MCLAQGRNAVAPVRFEPAAPRSRVKHSTTEPLRSHGMVEVRLSGFGFIKYEVRGILKQQLKIIKIKTALKTDVE